MAKRKYKTDDELRELLEQSDEGSEEFIDFSSDDSVKDPGWNPSDSSHDEHEESVERIELLLRDMQEVEDREDAEEVMRRDAEEIIQGESENVHNRYIPQWTEYQGRHKIFPFTGKSGLQIDVSKNISPYETFCLFVDDEVMNLIVEQTNKYAEQKIQVTRMSRHNRLNKWVSTNKEEIKKFLGLVLWMGLVPLGSIAAYWSTRPIYQNSIAPKVMARNRFELLLRLIHFSDNQNILMANRLGKIQPLIDILHDKYQTVYVPGHDFVIDETLVPWRGRLVFRQYIPNKAHKYGVKVFKLCAINGYTWNTKIYSGKSETYDKTIGLGKSVCLELSEKLLNQGRTLYVDNFYTSYELALSLLDKNTHTVGTLRSNKKYMPKDVMCAKLKRGQFIAREEGNGIVVLKWLDTRDVRMLSTKHAPQMAQLERGNEQPRNDQPSTSRGPRQRNKEKPQVVIDYNKGKAGIDLSDQMSSYATTLRKGVKWYRKLAMEYLLGISLVNALVVYKAATNKNIQIRCFREQVVEAMLDLPKTAEHPKKNYNVHTLATKMDENNKKIRRTCHVCYGKLKESEGRLTARNKSKRVFTVCVDCPNQPFMCLECFGEKHKTN